jgi:protein phosphatase
VRTADPAELVRAVQSANEAVIAAAHKGIGRTGMGTTMTALMVDEGRAVVAQVGDSRAYLLRNHTLTQITEDHSVVGSLLRAGHITAEEARTHPQRSVVTRALGSDPDMGVDSFEISLLRGDRLLLCSDGLYGMVDDAYISEILSEALDPNQAAQQLIDAALAGGGADNISVIVIDITEELAAQTHSRQKGKRSKLWLWALLWLLLVSLVLGGITWTIKRYAENRAYLRINEAGNVSICRGAPGKILGFNLTLSSQETSVVAATLSPEDRANLELSPLFSSVEDARRELEEMVATSPLLQSGQTPTQPEGGTTP